MPLITITQGIGCDGLAVAGRVAEVLKVSLYDDSRLKEQAIRMGLDAGKLEGFPPKTSAWLNRLLGDKPEVYSNLMGSVIYETARGGEGVIIGHGSQMLLQDFSCAMHVLVTATKDKRIRNLMNQMNLTREDAEKVVQKSDYQNKEFFQYVFHTDWDDPSLYDVCVNTAKVGVERASQTIVQTAGYPELKACNIYALEAIERLSQAKRIEASLSELDLKPLGLVVDVPEKGVVHISGILLNHEDKERIPEVVRGIPGVERIDMDVMVMPTEYS